jgi:hypothetical protein
MKNLLKQLDSMKKYYNDFAEYADSIEVKVKYIVNELNEVFLSVELHENEQEVEKFTQEFEFDGSKAKTHKAAQELVNALNKMNVEATYKRVIFN